MRLYPGMGHTINEDEIKAVRAMMGASVDRAGSGYIKAAEQRR
jgi:hypothetical protein